MPGNTEDTSAYQFSRHRRLWRRILLQALQDAHSNINSPQMHVARRHARVWLVSGSRDFQDVCLNAGIDPDYARDRFIAHFEPN